MSSEYKPHGFYAAPPDPDRCKASVHEKGRWTGSHQCYRKPWKDGWCRQHHPDTVAVRRAQSKTRSQQRHERSPLGRLKNDLERLRAAEDEITRLRVRIVELETERDRLQKAHDRRFGWLL